MKKIKELLTKYYPLLLIGVVTFISLTFASQCSFLYSMNRWNDVNCFFSVAMALNNGKVLYQDIYEQKGPYLYFLHQFIILISNGTYIGAYLIELVLGFVFAYFTYKSLSLYVSNKKYVTLATSLVIVFYYISFSFCQGDSVEELFIPFFLMSLYFALKALKTNTDIAYYHYALDGLIFGLALLMKFTLIAFYIPYMITLFIYLIKDKKVARAFINIALFILGFVVSIIPSLVYFGINDAYSSFFTVYFYNNLFLYGGENKENFFLKIWDFIVAYFSSLGIGYSYYLLIITSAVYLLMHRSLLKNRQVKLIIAIYVVLNFVIFIGGKNYAYYGLPNVIFAFLGTVAIYYFLRNNKKFLELYAKRSKLLTYSFVSFVLVLSVFGSQNTYRAFTKNEDLVQYKFKAEIDKVENATILNYGFLDLGCFYICNSAPTVKYFCGLNIAYPELIESQDNYVKEGATTFVISRNVEPTGIYDKYHLVMAVDAQIDYEMFTFYLFKLN